MAAGTDAPTKLALCIAPEPTLHASLLPGVEGRALHDSTLFLATPLARLLVQNLPPAKLHRDSGNTLRPRRWAPRPVRRAPRRAARSLPIAHFLTRELPIASASMPEPHNVRRPSGG